jgi:hypothetical protein
MWTHNLAQATNGLSGVGGWKSSLPGLPSRGVKERTSSLQTASAEGVGMTRYLDIDDGASFTGGVGEVTVNT